MEKLYLDGESGAIKIPADTSFLKELYITNLATIIQPISEVLANLSDLTTLSINHGIPTEHGDCARTIAAFVADSELLKLELLNCKATVSIMNSVKSSVRTLKLCGVFFKIEEARVLVNILTRASSSLIKLSLIKCDFTPETLILIADAIEKSKLKTLMLACHFQCDFTTIIADCIANSSLTKLSLQNSSFADGGHDIMFDAIKYSSLKILDVRKCPILNDFKMINNLILHKGLTKFFFSEGRLTAKEKSALLDSMQENCSLEHISFDSTHVCDDATLTDQLITKLCALLKDTRFKSFDLDSSLLSDAQLKRIIESIKQSSILSLEFSEFYPLDDSMMIVCDLLESYHFEKLKLHFTSYEDEHVEQILPVIQQSSITKFDISRSFMYKSCELQNAIESILQSQRERAQGRCTKSA